MIRSTILVSLAASAFLMTSFQRPQVQPIARCSNLWPSQPVLAFDIAGGTLAGPVNKHLVVYSDGHALFADMNSIFGSPRAAVVYLQPFEIEILRMNLATAGAYVACDDTAIVTDVPLRTVTVFGRTQDAPAHTFNYLIAGSAQSGTEQVIQQLIATHFPGF